MLLLNKEKKRALKSREGLKFRLSYSTLVEGLGAFLQEHTTP